VVALAAVACTLAQSPCDAINSGRQRRRRCLVCKASPPAPVPPLPPLPPPPAYEKQPKPLTPMCSTISPAQGEDYEGMNLKEYCKMLPNCYVKEESSTKWKCESALDICSSQKDQATCTGGARSNTLCTWTGKKCMPKRQTWSPLDVAVNWLNTVNNGVGACNDVAGLFVATPNSIKGPPLLLGTVGSPDLNKDSGYDVGRDQIASYFCKTFLPNAPQAFVCGVSDENDVCAPALAVGSGGSPGPLTRGLPMYSAILDKDFSGGNVVLGNPSVGLPYGASTISGNWGFQYREGPRAGKTFLARFTFIINQDGYIQTLHSDFVPDP